MTQSARPLAIELFNEDARVPHGVDPDETGQDAYTRWRGAARAIQHSDPQDDLTERLDAIDCDDFAAHYEQERRSWTANNK